LIDAHCHLDLYPNPANVIQEIERQGLYVIAVTTTPKAFEGNLRFVGKSKRIRVAVGLHPELVKDRACEIVQLCSLISKTKYVGEVGLDGSPEHKESFGLQREILTTIFSACLKEGGRIISIHSRSAASIVLDEIERAPGLGVPILHWFSGSKRELVRAINLGCWFSVGASMLASKRGAALASCMPIDRILTETDGPFGMIEKKPLMPWDVKKSIIQLASIFSIPPDEVERLIHRNLRSLLECVPEPSSQPNVLGKTEV
jgi:TatD DNase family protein